MPNYARIFAKFCTTPVLFQTSAFVPDSSGDTGTEVLSAGTSLLASVQQSGEDRIITHAAVGSRLTHNIYFAAIPVDTSAGARPGCLCREMDRFTKLGAVFYALGPALPQGDPGVAWLVECEERA